MRALTPQELSQGAAALLRLVRENTSAANPTVRMSFLGAKLKEILPEYNKKSGVTMASLEKELVQKRLVFKQGVAGTLSLGLMGKAARVRGTSERYTKVPIRLPGLSEGAQLLLRILRKETSKAKGSTVQLGLLGNKLKSQWNHYRTGCVKELAQELAKAGLATRGMEGKSTATLSLSSVKASVSR